MRLDESAGLSETPTVGVDDEGDVMVAWSQDTGSSTYRIARNFYDASAGALTGEVVLTGYGESATDDSYNPQLDSNDEGDIALIWWDAPASGARGVYSTVYDASEDSWSATQPLIVPADPAHGLYSSTGRPAIGIDGAGDAYAAFSYWNGSAQNILASKYDGTWSAATPVEDATAVCRRPIIATSESGKSVVVYDVGGSSGPFEVRASSIDADLNYSDKRLVASVASGASGSGVTVGIDGANIGSAVWLESGDVKWSTQDGTGNWSDPISLTTVSAPAATVNRLAVSQSGRIYAAWLQDGKEMFARF
jgi:hypothetical protein